MSEDLPHPSDFEGAGFRFGIVASRFNQRLVDDLLERCLRTLDEAGVHEEDVETVRVPGAHEVPYVAAMLAKGWEFDAVIALGVVVGGDTSHHEVIAESTSAALQRVAIDTEIPVINGIITTETRDQAEARCSGKHNRGREFALGALEMAEIKRRLIQRLDEIEAMNAESRNEDDDDWTGLSGDDPGKNPWKL